MKIFKKKIDIGDLVLTTFFLLLTSAFFNFVFERIFEVKYPEFPLLANIIETMFLIPSLLGVVILIALLFISLFPINKES